MKVSFEPQGSTAWFRQRMGKITASELGNLLTGSFEHRTGEMPKTYMYSKLAEAWRGKPLIFTGSWATEQGELREEQAIPFLALEKEWKINEVGFIETDDGRIGCSPDGYVGNPENPQPSDFGVEVKCPEPAQHVRYLIEGVLPKAYATQVHGSMFVTGLSKWVFMSYNRGLPPFILEVERDEAIIAKIGEAINRFHANMEIAKAKMEEWNK